MIGFVLGRDSKPPPPAVCVLASAYVTDAVPTAGRRTDIQPRIANTTSMKALSTRTPSV